MQKSKITAIYPIVQCSYNISRLQNPDAAYKFPTARLSSRPWMFKGCSAWKKNLIVPLQSDQDFMAIDLVVIILKFSININRMQSNYNRFLLDHNLFKNEYSELAFL